MTPSRRALITGCLLALVRCIPGPLDLTGKQCSPDRPCGPGYTCAFSLCQPGGPPAPVNLLANPDFEENLPDGGVPNWRVTGLGKLSLETQTVFSGKQAAHVLSTDADGGISPRLAADSLPDAGQFLFCANARVYGLGTSASAKATLNLGAKFDGGGLTAGGTSSTVQVASQWQELTASIDTTQFGIDPDNLSFAVVSTSLGAGQILIVDDAWLYAPYDGQCP